MALLVGGTLMLSAGVLFYTQSERLPYWFLSTRHNDVAVMTAPLLRIVAFGHARPGPDDDP